MRISDWSSDVCSADLALTAEGMTPDWVAGISIGAINAAIVAGNPPERRVAQLRQFWETVSANWIAAPAIEDDQFREAYHQLSAASPLLRSEERRVGKGCVSTCRSRRLPDNTKK